MAFILFLWGEGLPDRLAELVFDPHQPFHGCGWYVANQEEFRGDGFGDHAIHPQDAIAGRSDGRVVEGVEPVLD